MSVFAEDNLFEEFQESNEDESVDEESEEEELNTVLNEYKEENAKLKLENEELKKALRVITQPANVKIRDSHKDGPVAQVLLFNNVLNNRHQVEEIKDFFRQVSSYRHNDEPANTQSQLSGVQFPGCQQQSYKPPRSDRDQRKAHKSFVVTRSFQVYNDCFYLDQIGEPLQKNEKTDCKIPDYDKAHMDALDGEMEIPETDPNIFSKASRLCFNCGMKDHQVKDCPSPRDFRSINQRRQKYLDKVSNSPQAGSTRYHADKEIDESDPRFSDFKPGVISDTLRAALGMEEKDLPPYIYQMRMLGYPPGHLCDARSTVSGLSLYNGTTGKKDDSDTDGNEGLLDIDKIIDYPGFNMKLPSNVHDNHREMNMMPMDERQSKEVMVSYHKHRNAIVRRKMDKENEEICSAKRRKVNNNQAENAACVEQDNTVQVDMELGGESPPSKSSDHVEDTQQVGLNVEDEEPEGEIGEDQDGEEVVDLSNDAEEFVMDPGELSEDELQRRREIILKKLKEQCGVKQEDEEVVVVSSETDQSVIVVDSSSSSADEVEVEKYTRSQDTVVSEHLFEEINENGDRTTNQPTVDKLEGTVDVAAVIEDNINSEAVELSNSSLPEPGSIDIAENTENTSTNNHNVSSVETCTQQITTDSNATPVELITDSTESATVSTMDTSVGENSCDEVSAKGLPHRSKFAEGVTQFDAYYTETKSSGIFNKLRGLLKHSPMRQSKNS